MNCFATGRSKGKGRRAQMIRFWNNSECAIPIWTKIGTTKQLDTKNKPLMLNSVLTSHTMHRGQIGDATRRSRCTSGGQEAYHGGNT